MGSEEDEVDLHIGYISEQPLKEPWKLDHLVEIYDGICMPRRRPSAYESSFQSSDEQFETLLSSYIVDENSVPYKQRRVSRVTFNNIMQESIKSAESNLADNNDKSLSTSMFEGLIRKNSNSSIATIGSKGSTSVVDEDIKPFNTEITNNNEIKPKKKLSTSSDIVSKSVENDLDLKTMGESSKTIIRSGSFDTDAKPKLNLKDLLPMKSSDQESMSFMSSRFARAPSHEGLDGSQESLNNEGQEPRNEAQNEDTFLSKSLFNISTLFSSRPNSSSSIKSYPKSSMSRSPSNAGSKRLFQLKQEDLDSYQSICDFDEDEVQYFLPTDVLIDSEDLKKEWTYFLNKKNIDENDIENIYMLAIKGIPNGIRGKVWKFLITLDKGENFQFGGGQILSEFQNVNNARFQGTGKNLTYKLFNKLKPNNNEPQNENIKTDIDAIFEKHPVFKKEQEKKKLYDIVVAYSNFDPDVNYSAGLLFFVSVLLLVLNEIDAFNILKYMMTILNMRALFSQSTEPCLILVYQFNRIIYERYPQIFEHFSAQKLEISSFCSHWFLSLFAFQFQPHFVTRVFDFLLIKGSKFLLQVSLAFLECHRSQILEQPDSASLLTFFKTTIPKKYNYVRSDNSKSNDDKLRESCEFRECLIKIADSIKTSDVMLHFFVSEYYLMIEKMNSEELEATMKNRFFRIKEQLEEQKVNLVEMKKEYDSACEVFSITHKETTDVMFNENESDIKQLEKEYKEAEILCNSKIYALELELERDIDVLKEEYAIGVEKVAEECKAIIERVGKQCNNLVNDNESENDEKLANAKEQRNTLSVMLGEELNSLTKDQENVLNRLNKEFTTQCEKRNQLEEKHKTELEKIKIEHDVHKLKIENENKQMLDNIVNWKAINKKQEIQLTEFSNELRDTKREANSLKNECVKEKNELDRAHRNEVDKLKRQLTALSRNFGKVEKSLQEKQVLLEMEKKKKLAEQG